MILAVAIVSRYCAYWVLASLNSEGFQILSNAFVVEFIRFIYLEFGNSEGLYPGYR